MSLAGSGHTTKRGPAEVDRIALHLTLRWAGTTRDDVLAHMASRLEEKQVTTTSSNGCDR